MGANFVIAYGYDRLNGRYTGTVNAWEDQLDPGNFILPAHATFEAPPEPVEGKYRVWNGSAWTLVDIPAPPTPPTPTTEELAAAAREQRNTLLYECDWTQLPDLPPALIAQAAAWAAYRQALRDVTQQPSFPNTITWPTKPGE